MVAYVNTDLRDPLLCSDGTLIRQGGFHTATLQERQATSPTGLSCG